MADDNKISVVKDVRPGIKNLNLVFIVIDVGKLNKDLLHIVSYNTNSCMKKLIAKSIA